MTRSLRKSMLINAMLVFLALMLIEVAGHTIDSRLQLKIIATRIGQVLKAPRRDASDRVRLSIRDIGYFVYSWHRSNGTMPTVQAIVSELTIPEGVVLKLVPQNLACRYVPEQIFVIAEFQGKQWMATGHGVYEAREIVFGNRARLGDFVSSEDILFSDASALADWKRIVPAGVRDTMTVSGNRILRLTRGETICSFSYSDFEKSIKLSILSSESKEVYVASAGKDSGIKSIRRIGREEN